MAVNPHLGRIFILELFHPAVLSGVVKGNKLLAVLEIACGLWMKGIVGFLSIFAVAS